MRRNTALLTRPPTTRFDIEGIYAKHEMAGGSRITINGNDGWLLGANLGWISAVTIAARADMGIRYRIRRVARQRGASLESGTERCISSYAGRRGEGGSLVSHFFWATIFE
jgi:hypothetical protein